jgi:flagellar motility protein MotE (MotC chaperone)
MKKFFIVKFSVLAGCFVLYVAGKNKFFRNSIQSVVPAASAAEEPIDSAVNNAVKSAGTASSTPSIPSGNLSISEASRIRMSLEKLKAEVEQKISLYEQNKKIHAETKKSLELEKKQLEEEKQLLQASLQKEKEAQGQRLTEALEFIGKMEAKKASAVLESMDRDLVIQIMRKLPPKQTTKILENLNPRKASEYMEYYTRIKSGREFELLKELGLCPAPKEEIKK